MKLKGRVFLRFYIVYVYLFIEIKKKCLVYDLCK